MRDEDLVETISIEITENDPFYEDRIISENLYSIDIFDLFERNEFFESFTNNQDFENIENNDIFRNPAEMKTQYQSHLFVRM